MTLSKPIHTPTSSWYQATAQPKPACPKLQGHHRTDICIVGAGVTGLNTAIELAEKGYAVTVLEAHEVGYGASGRSGGQIIFGYGCDQSVLEKHLGLAAARDLWQLSLEGVQLVQERIERYGIACDHQPGHAHVALKHRQVDELKRWQHKLAETYDYEGLTFWDRSRVQQEIASPQYLAGLYDARSGHLHPLNYTLGLAKAAEASGVVIHEHSRVTDVQENGDVQVSTAEGKVTAASAVLAGNAYLHKLAPPVEAKLMPVGTYIAATGTLGAPLCKQLIRNNCAVADMNLALDYFRLSSDHRLLFGGLVAYSGREPRRLQQIMARRIAQVFPQLAPVKLAYTWGGYIGITANRAPHFGRIGNNLYFAQGYSGHGLAAAGVAGRVLAEAIAGSHEKLDVFEKIAHADFPGGKLLRTPALVLAMSWFRLRDWL